MIVSNKMLRDVQYTAYLHYVVVKLHSKEFLIKLWGKYYDKVKVEAPGGGFFNRAHFLGKHFDNFTAQLRKNGFVMICTSLY